MTAWEYGYVYVVHTVGPSPAVCIVVDGQQRQVLADCHGLIHAANAVGADGWIVSGHGEKMPCPRWVDDMVRPIEGAFHGDTVMCYFMRRPLESVPVESVQIPS